MTFICNPGESRTPPNPTALHTLKATPKTVHWGYFDASIAPVLTVKSGDLVQAEAITHHAGDAPELMMDETVTTLFREIPESDRNPGVHIMTGPIFIEGAEPGDMIEVRYLSMTPRCAYGSNLAANWGYLYKEFGEKERVTIYELDANTQSASALYAYDFQGKYLVPGTITHCPVCDREPALKGVRVPARPHLGTAGVAPAIDGRTSTIPPGVHGGNIDNWRIGAGATMYYPVQVKGGLFSIGDPHVSQGDGEISGTAIEASLDVLFQIILRKDFRFPSPLMLELLHGHVGLSKNEAYSLMSVSTDAAVTQVVDGRQGCHMRIPRAIFPQKGSATEPE